MKHPLLASLVSLCLFATLSCFKNSDNNCGSIEFAAISLYGLDCYISMGSPDTLTDELFVVNSLEELNDHVQIYADENSPKCQQAKNSLNAIDFSKYSMLVGRKVVPQIPGIFVSQSVERKCKTDKIIYHAICKPGGYTAFGFFYYGVIIPKVSPHTQVVAEVQVLKH